MITTVTKPEFVKAFDDYHRSDNFSVAGRKVLFEYLENLEDDTLEQIEFDVIALCCDYTEYDSFEDFQIDNDVAEKYPDIESLEAVTTVIPVGNEGLIVQAF